MAWFVYRSLLRHADLVALVEDIEYKIDFFSQHLKSLYELPVFYGEPTIENLIEHSKLLLTSFEKFNKDYDLFNGEEVEEDELQETVKDEDRSS
jgi:hypothetical protein